MEDLLNDILRAADKHPNSKVSKLIRTVEEEPSQKNIVLLLIELSDHAEYATDFNISLRYYLDFFERLGIGRDLMLNEAGLLLVNSSKIYSKRVDYVQSLVERQIMTLSNADLEIQQKEQNQQEATGDTATPAEKPKRGRKRVLDAPTDPYEIHLEPKKFKKMTHEKRFALPKTPTKAKLLSRNIEMEQQIHPAVWKYATIYDLENEEDVDTKRNYKLFTYHIEHRYNTLVPDINFRLHFKVKDYMDAQEEEMEDDETVNHTDYTEVWPSLSEEYVRKYISLENRVLQREIDPTIPYVSPKRVKKVPKVTVFNDVDEMDNDETMILEVPVQNLDVSQAETLETSVQNVDAAGASDNTIEVSVQNLDTTTANDSLSINDSGLGTSLLDSSNNSTMQLNITQHDTSADDTKLINSTTITEEEGKLLEASQTNTENDSALGDSILDQTNICNDVTMELPTSLETGHSVDTTLGVITTLTVNVCEEQTTNSANAASTSIESTESTENVLNIQEDASKDVTDNLETSPAPKETVSLDSSNFESANTENGNSFNKDTTSSAEINENETNKIHIISESLNETQDIAVTLEKALGEEKSVANTEDVQKDTSKEGKMNVYQVEIEIENNEGNAESKTIQIQVPNGTDDEGVHLSEAFEDDFRILSPTTMPGNERKDVTIYLDEQLREVLALRDDMVEHFSQETYQVPVVEEPKEQPLIFNMLKLPPKLFKRKTLFKLGPDMDLFLKARMLKLSRPTPPPKAVRMPKQLQFFPLNNTDMSGIPATPPNSPGHCSDFLGFTDDEVVDDDETTCTEFCGFTEEEQENLLINIHRLSRDSGVGVDVTTLTPEKDHLVTIFEENMAPETSKCKLNLSKELENNCDADASGLTNESTDELLSNLPSSIRNVLEAEMQQCHTEPSREINVSNTENNVEGDSANAKIYGNVQKEAVTETQDKTNTLTENGETSIESSPNNDSEGQTKTNENVEQQTTEDISNDQMSAKNASEAVSDNVNLNEGTIMEKETIIETQTPGDTINTGSEQENNTTSGDTMQTLSEDRESAEEVQQFIDDIITNVCKEIEFPNADETNDSHIGINIDSEVSEANTMQVQKKNASEATATNKDHSNIDDVDNANDSGSESSHQDESFFDLDTQGAKTKIQQWHEHLRPILAKSRERHHFDVFQIGTEIIETIQSDEDVEQNNTGIATFGDIMDNKDKSYVSRYFLSTLLLANQSNVSISVENKSSEKPSSWSDIQLKLLSTKRHTVAIEDNIGMITSANKRKNVQPIEDKVKKKKIKSQRSTDDGDSSADDCEPLMDLQAVIKNAQVSPTNRAQNCENQNVDLKRNNKGQAIRLAQQNLVRTRPEDNQIVKQIHAPLTDFSPVMPSTSKQALQKAQNCEVNLSSIRILQPVEKIPREGDDLDSGIFSVGEMSVS